MTDQAHSSPSPVRPLPRGIGGARARLSYDTEGQALGALMTAAVRAPLTADEVWRTWDLDASTLSRMSPERLLELLADASPEVSRALWDFLRMCNPGWEAVALRPSGARAAETAQTALRGIIGRIEALYTSLDVPIARLYMGAFLRGALFAEIVLDEAGRQAVDLATPDPASATFRQVRDPVRGVIWQMGQYQGGTWVALEAPTVRYVPLDPMPGQPTGRPMAAPALFAGVFLLALLHDVRRVVQQQGWPRIDVAVKLDALLTAMPRDAQGDPEAWKAWIEGTIREVQDAYADLEPDDAYIHTDVVTVNRPVGAVDASSLGAVEGIIASLERMLARALKTQPLLFGIPEGMSEANANRQWEIHAAGIKAVQHLAEKLLGALLTVALQAEGVPAVAQVRFAELRASEMLRDAQTEQLQIQNARARYDNGWISQDEAAAAGAGVDRADAPAPRDTAAAPGSLIGAGTVDPGALQ